MRPSEGDPDDEVVFVASAVDEIDLHVLLDEGEGMALLSVLGVIALFIALLIAIARSGAFE
jgi:hypothetical protein